MFQTTHDLTKIDTAKWAEFVQKHPFGTYFQTPEYFDLYSHTEKCMPIATFIFDGNRIVGLFICIIFEDGGTIIKHLTRRAICFGGPIVANNDATIERLLFASNKNLLKAHGCIYCEIRPILEPLNNNYQIYKFAYEPHLNILLDITVSKNNLYQNLHKERRRNIKHAEKEGLIFKELTSIAEISEFVEIIQQTYKRKQVPLSYYDIFNRAFNKFNSSIHFFGCFLGDKMIGGQARIFYKDYVYAWFAGSDDNYFKFRPNDFLTWNVLLWSKAHGYSTFDFGGGGKPDVPYGVRDYKMKYGCTLYEYGRYKCINKPLLYILGKIGYSIIHKTK